MMGSVICIKSLFAFLFMCAFSSVVYGVGSPAVLTVESRLPLRLSVSDHGRSYSLSIPTDFMREIEGVYEKVYVDDLTGDGVGEVVFRLSEEGVNICYKVLRYNVGERSLSELEFGLGGLCNYKLGAGYVVSEYKDGATWIEDIYTVTGGKLNLRISDRCVGCGEVSRIEYLSNGSNVRTLVSDDLNFEKRHALISEVISPKARIYSAVVKDEATKKYLIRGDRITLMALENVKGEDWVEFRFSGKTPVDGWLKCSDIDYCNGI